MTTDVDKVALTIFVAFFVLVTVMGFIAARWRRPKTLARLEEWGQGSFEVRSGSNSAVVLDRPARQLTPR